ncbi:MAG: outer membrane lipoprotein carrier protein LolA [Verrucomicrobiae bacterium]|nr:outer membrane lipoprotein carrier protein LolA [Verrucomicrobiae bacterium]
MSDAEQARHEKQFTQYQHSTKTFTAAVRQILHLSGMKKPVVSLGRIYFQNPQGWLLIRYSKPAEEFILLRDGKLYLQKKDKPLKIQSLNRENSFAMMRRFFQEDAQSWKKDFDIAMFEDEKNLIISLTPKRKEKTLPLVIQTRVNRQTFLPQQIHLVFEGENEIIYEFTQPQRNATLPSQLFAPPDAS